MVLGTIDMAGIQPHLLNLFSIFRGVQRANAMTLLCGRGRILISLIRCVRAFMGIAARKRSRVLDNVRVN